LRRFLHFHQTANTLDDTRKMSTAIVLLQKDSSAKSSRIISLSFFSYRAVILDKKVGAHFHVWLILITEIAQRVGNIGMGELPLGFWF